MKLWEAIVYGIFGGLTELLPVSFQGHIVFLQGAFNLSPLTGSGYFVRAALCLGISFAVLLSFSTESGSMGRELLKMTGLKKRRRKERGNLLLRRSILLCFFALIPLLFSFAYTAFAHRFTSLFYTALLFALNGIVISVCFRRAPWDKTEAETTVLDTLLMGLARAASVFPGLSSVGSSLAVGNVRGLAREYNLRLAYLLTLFYELAAFIYYLTFGFIYGSFSLSLILPILVALFVATVSGYFGIQYLRYMMRHGKLDFFSYYCWTLTGILLFLSVVNA